MSLDCPLIGNNRVLRAVPNMAVGRGFCRDAKTLINGAKPLVDGREGWWREKGRKGH
jgi:hypothetical protein